MEKIKFNITVPDKEEYRCECGSLEYTIEEVSHKKGFKRRHHKKNYVTCTMICSKCGEVAQHELRNKLFAK